MRHNVDRLEGICLIVYILTSASLLGWYVFLVAKFICKIVYNNKVYIYKYQSYISKVYTYLSLYAVLPVNCPSITTLNSKSTEINYPMNVKMTPPAIRDR